MSPRGKNLLEAFSNGSAKPAPSSAPSAPQSGAPSLPLLGASGARGGLVLRASQVQWLVLAQVVLIVLAFLLGRASVSSVVAASGDEPTRAPQTPAAAGGNPAASATPKPQQPEVQTPAAAKPQPVAPPVAQTPPQQPAVQPAGAAPAPTQVDSTPRTAAEQALLDPRNVYTIIVAQYSASDANIKLAREALKYLSESCALPACLTRQGKKLFMVVGAAPRQADLDTLLKSVKELKGPPPGSKAREFHDAYLVKIDTVFQRN